MDILASAIVTAVALASAAAVLVVAWWPKKYVYEEQIGEYRIRLEFHSMDELEERLEEVMERFNHRQQEKGSGPHQS